MGVREALGVEEMVEDADQLWPMWAEAEPVLGRFAGVRDVERWRLDAGRDDVREVFLALGRISLDDERGEYATAVLVWMMLPACEAVVARRNRGNVAVDELTHVAAGYLWTVVAEYPWHEPLDGSIPMAVQRDVGRAIDREYGWGDRGDGTWRGRAQLEQAQAERIPAASGQPMQSLDVYFWALSEAGLPRDDMELLVQLSVVATDVGAKSRTSAGLTSRAACKVVAAREGRSVDQVQYQAMKALTVLREAAVAA